MSIRIKSKLVKRISISIVSIIVFSQLFSGCFSFRMSNREINTYVEELPEGAEYSYYELDNRKMHYVTTGGDNLPTVIFIHGSPGSLSAFKHFLQDSSLTNQARLITIDRPGFGQSNFGWSEKSLKKQSLLLKPILEFGNQSDSPVILVGHSLGGPLIARMTMDFPQLVDGIIMVAPSIDPALEPEEWFRPILYSPFFRWIVPKSFRVSNDEIYFLKKELEEMLPLWKNITILVSVIQGGKDTFVPPGNADFAKKMLINTDPHIVIKEDMNHFVPWNNYDLIKDEIEWQLKSLDLHTAKTF